MVSESSNKPYVPDTLLTDWYKAFERSGKCPGKNCMWTQLHLFYTALSSDKYTVYAKCESGLSLAVNHRESGLHYAKKLGVDNQLLRTHLPSMLLHFPQSPSVLSWSGKIAGSIANSPSVAEKDQFRANESTLVLDFAIQLQASQSCKSVLGWTPIIILNKGFLPLLDNWIHVVQNISYNILQCSLFLTIDTESEAHLRQRYSLPWMIRWSTKHNGKMKYGTEVYANLMTSRLKLVRDMLLHGINVAILEVYYGCTIVCAYLPWL